MKVEWTEVALQDLTDIRDHIAGDSPYYARHFIEKILAASEKLGQHPEIGRRVPEAGRDDIRELIYRSYRIIYLVAADRVNILTVVHGRRDVAGRSAKPWDVI